MVLGRSGNAWLALLACGCFQTALGESATNLRDADATVDAARADTGALLPDSGVMQDANVPSDATVMRDANIVFDAGADVFVYDAGCNGTDGDQDGFCAEADNCPEVNNPSQADADNDRKGDACDPPCGADPIPEQLRLNFGVINRASIADGGNFAEIAPGATFDLTIDYGFDFCVPGVGTLGQNLQMGFEHKSQGVCAASRFLCNLATTGTVTESFTAPDTPGVYYLQVVLSGAAPCVVGTLAPWLTATASNARIAAICVQ